MPSSNQNCYTTSAMPICLFTTLGETLKHSWNKSHPPLTLVTRGCWGLQAGPARLARLNERRCLKGIGIWRPPAVSSVPVHISTSVTANRQRWADRDTRNSICGCLLFLKNSPLKYEDLRHDGCSGQELGALPPTPRDFSHKGTVHAHGEGRDIHRILDRMPTFSALYLLWETDRAQISDFHTLSPRTQGLCRTASRLSWAGEGMGEDLGSNPRQHRVPLTLLGWDSLKTGFCCKSEVQK